VTGARGLGLAEALERAASALREHARAIRPANGDPARLLEGLGPEAGAQVLAWLLEREPIDGEELAGAWAEDESPGLEALRRVEAERLPKPAQKILRRVLHRLRSRGVDVPAAEPPARVVAKLPPIEDTLSAALVSPIDPRGTRAVYLVEPHPSGGARMFELLIDSERGVVGFEVYQAGRSQVRRFLRGIRSQERFPALEAPRESIAALIARAVAAQPADRPLPSGFAEWRAELCAAPAGTRTPGELAEEALAGDATPERLRRAVALVRGREIGPWAPPADLLQPLAERLLESGKGQIIVAAPVRREQAARAIDEAIGSIYAGPHAARTAECLRETAYVFWKTGREEEARAALAAAKAIASGPASGAEVARALLEVALAPVLERLEQDLASEDERSRLVKT
jgi:hypothetical protein